MSRIFRKFLNINKFNFSIDKNELKKRLTPEQFYVTQEKGTERPFSNEYWNHYEEGIYLCIVCENELFLSNHKFDSSSGWPSFYDVKNKMNLKVKEDNSHGMKREEVLCKCNSHLGHLFNDGPKQFTGQRYCINSSSLFFKKI